MANVIRYKTSQPTKRGLRKGNTVVGIGEENYGPTSTTGYVNGITPPDGGYVIYTLNGTSPVIYVANSDDDLPAIARTLGGGELDYLAAKNYLDSRSNTWILDNTPKNTISDGLVLDLNAKNISSFLDNKPIENLVPSGGRTGDSALPRQSYHIRAWTYSIEQNFVGRDSVIKLYINPPGTDSTAPYADYGFYAYRSGGSQVGDVYTISMDYYVAKGNSSPAITIAYANGYKNPTSAQAASWGSATIVDLGNGWYRRIQSATITIAGNTWWRGGIGSNNIETEAYIDNIQVELNSTATPFVDGTRSQNTTWKDISGYGNNGTLINGTGYSNGALVFDGSNDYVGFAGGVTSSFNPTEFTVEAVVNYDAFGVVNSSRPYVSNWNTWSPGSQKGFILRTYGVSQNPSFWWCDGTNYTSITATTTMTTGKYYHILATYSSSGVKLYVNGNVEATSGNLLTGVEFGSALRIGWGTINQGWFDGKISLVRMYNKALSQVEVGQNYYGGPIVTDGLVFATDAGNLVSYESGSSTTYSLTGSDSGTLSNGVAYNSKNGGVWEFDGIDDHINLGDNSLFDFTNGICTVEAVIKFPSSWTGGSQYPNIVSKGATAGWDTDGWALFGFRDWPSAGQKSWGFGIRNGATVRTVYIANRATDVYLHVVAILDGSTMRLYENGVQVNTNTQTINPASNSTNVYIGRDAASNYFPGDIPYVRAYNRVLTPSEVLQNFNAQKARFGL